MQARLESTAYASEPWQTLDLLADPDGDAYTQSGIAAVTCAVYDLSSSTPATDLFVGTQPSASNFFNTLQTDSGWNRPDGFNFKHIVAPADLNGAINGGHVFKVVYTIETVLDLTRVLEHLVTVLS